MSPHTIVSLVAANPNARIGVAFPSAVATSAGLKTLFDHCRSRGIDATYRPQQHEVLIGNATVVGFYDTGKIRGIELSNLVHDRNVDPELLDAARLRVRL